MSPVGWVGPKPYPWVALFASAPDGRTVWLPSCLVVIALAVFATLHLNIVDVTPTFRRFLLAWRILGLLPCHFDHMRHRANLHEQAIEVISTNHRQMFNTGFRVMPFDAVQERWLMVLPTRGSLAWVVRLRSRFRLGRLDCWGLCRWCGGVVLFAWSWLLLLGLESCDRSQWDLDHPAGSFALYPTLCTMKNVLSMPFYRFIETFLFPGGVRIISPLTS